MKRIIFSISLAIFVSSAFAQTYKQRGVVRMITSSASAPTTPVKGVNVVVENNVSDATGADGSFRVDVTKEFVVSGIVQETSPEHDQREQYILALPTRGKTYYYSKNDLDVVVTTKAKREADYKKLYQQIREKYDAQTDEVNRLRREYKQRLADLDAADAEYVDLQVKLDSLQALYEEIIDNEDNIDDLISDISDDLAITDYLSLDDFNRKIFDLKCAGEWKSISDLLSEVMHGDAASYLQSAIDNKTKAASAKKKAEALERAAKEDLAARFRHVEDAIKAFKMQHLNDSVSRYYEILTKAAPDNWDYFDDAAIFEDNFMANYEKALDYYDQALKIENLTDSLRAATNNSIGAVWLPLHEYDKAMDYFHKAIELNVKLFGEEYIDLANNYINIGIVALTYKKDPKTAIEYFEKGEKILLTEFPADDPIVAQLLNNMGLAYNSLHEKEKAKEYFERAIAGFQTREGYELHIAKTSTALGGYYEERQEFATALDYYKKALDTFKTFLPADNPMIKMVEERVEVCEENLEEKRKLP